MIKVQLSALISIFALVACGGGRDGIDTDQPSAAHERQEREWDEEEVDDASVHPAIAGCLALVAESNYAEARTRCLEALRIDPENAEVAAALERAKSAETAPPGP